MADNKLWLNHPATKTTLYLAKYYQATGWHVTTTAEKICDAFNLVAFHHLSNEERAAIDRSSRTGPPFAKGSPLGDDWILQYESVTTKDRCPCCRGEAVMETYSSPCTPLQYFLLCRNPECQARGPWRRTAEAAVNAWYTDPDGAQP